MRFITDKPAHFWHIHFWLPLILAAFMVVLYPITSLDFYLIAPYFDTATHSFPLSNHWFFENIMHTGLKNCIVLVAIGLLLTWLAGFKIKTFAPQQKQYLWTFVGMVLATSVVSLLKHNSIHGCPSSLSLFGGTLPYLELFASLPAGAEMGKCFPGGHASGGFALMAFYFAFRDAKPKLAHWMLVIGLLMGFVMGWAQMMRGAHFLSHNLWTAWVVWMLLLAQYLVWPPAKLPLKA